MAQSSTVGSQVPLDGFLVLGSEVQGQVPLSLSAVLITKALCTHPHHHSPPPAFHAHMALLPPASIPAHLPANSALC